MKNLILSVLFIILIGYVTAENIQFYKTSTADNATILPSIWGIDQTAESEPVLVISRDNLVDAEIIHSPQSKRIIFQVDESKKKELENVTSQLIGERLLFVFDDVVLMNPIVQSTLSEGRFLVDLNDSHQTFNSMVSKLGLEDIMNQKMDLELSESRKRSRFYILIMTIMLLSLMLYLFIPKINRRKEA